MGGKFLTVYLEVAGSCLYIDKETIWEKVEVIISFRYMA